MRRAPRVPYGAVALAKPAGRSSGGAFGASRAPGARPKAARKDPPPRGGTSQLGSLRPSPPLVVGLAGGVASGKSTCARLLAGRDGVVIDADAVVREVQEEPTTIDEMERILGTPIRDAHGALDRGAAAAAAFSDPRKREALELYLHPLVRRRIEARLEAARRDAEATGAPRLVVLDVPLLFEGGLSERCDQIVFVESQESERARRAGESRGWDASEVARRESHQWSLAEKRRRAHHVLPNVGTVEDLAREAAKVREALLAEPH